MTTLANQYARLVGAFHNDAPFKKLDTQILTGVVCRDRLAVNVFCQGNDVITLLTFGAQKIFGADSQKRDTLSTRTISRWDHILI